MSSVFHPMHRKPRLLDSYLEMAAALRDAGLAVRGAIRSIDTTAMWWVLPPDPWVVARRAEVRRVQHRTARRRGKRVRG